MDFTQILNDLKRNVKKYSPEIMVGVGIAGMITGTVMAVRATPKALVLIEEEKKERKISEEVGNTDYNKCYDRKIDTSNVELSKFDIIKTTWKCYMPSVIVSSLSIACLVGASAKNHKRNAALATAYSLSETALKTYQAKVIETIGEKKEQEVQDAVAKEQLRRTPPTKTNIIVTGNGETRCFDAWSGRYFTSDVNKLKEAENTINEQMREENSVSLNDLYYEIGLESTEMGEYLGWNIDNGYVKFTFSSQLDANNVPCLVIGFTRPPEYDFA